MEDLHRLTNLKKVCLKDSFPLPRIDQLVDVMGNTRAPKLHRCVLGIQSYPHVRARWGAHILHHRLWTLLLQGNVVHPEKCRSYLPETSERDVQWSNRENNGGVHGRYISKINGSSRSYGSFRTNVFHFEEITNKTQPLEVCIWRRIRKFFWFYG